MNERLLRNPETPFQFGDDDECKLLLTELGLISRFSASVDSTTQTLTEFNHKTHWIYAMFFQGKPVKTDNGYFIVCFPKNWMKMPQFLSAMEDLNQKQGIAVVKKMVPPDSSDN